MRWALLLALVCGCPEHGSRGLPNPIDAATDPMVCLAELDAALDRSCTVSTDCVLIDHGDCCGIVKLAVHIGTEASANAAEAEFQNCRDCPPLGCAHPDMAEDGNVAGAGQSIVATCLSGTRCTSVVQ